MLSRIRSRLTYANVIATLALFLVLSGGTAVALTGSNTVFSDDIVDNQVTGADVKEASLGRVPQAGNAGTLDGRDSTHFGVGVMGGLMKDVGISDVANGTAWAPTGASAASATGSFIAPSGGFVARDLRISLDARNAANETWTFAFSPSSASGALSCAVPANARSCSDTTHAVTVTAGQRYSIMVPAVQNPTGTVDVSFGWRAVSP